MVPYLVKKIFDDESGQGITEYGALVAFVAVIIATVFSVGHGSLAAALKSSFSGVTNSINQLAAGAS